MRFHVGSRVCHASGVSASVVTALAICANPLFAQDTTATTAARAALGPRCKGETISLVIVSRQEPVIVERSTWWSPPVLRF